MHECSKHILHESEAQGLYVVTHECTVFHTALVGASVLTGLYPHRCNSTTCTSVLSRLNLTTGPGACCTTGQYLDIALPTD